MGSRIRLRAIGQCRRRKIRCIFDTENPQKRCASCIRLDRECNFYRVGQPPQAVLEVHHGASGAWRLSPASRLNQLGRTSDAQNGLPYPNMGIQYLGSAELRNDNFASENRGPRDRVSQHISGVPVLNFPGLVFGAPDEYPTQSAPEIPLQSNILPPTGPVASTSTFWLADTQEAPKFSMGFQDLRPDYHTCPGTAVLSNHPGELYQPIYLGNMPHHG